MYESIRRESPLKLNLLLAEGEASLESLVIQRDRMLSKIDKWCEWARLDAEEQKAETNGYTAVLNTTLRDFEALKGMRRYLKGVLVFFGRRNVDLIGDTILWLEKGTVCIEKQIRGGTWPIEEKAL